ncbi:MAG TPA: hypothetical protein ENG66_08525 [Thermococcus sp.]|nr:hypothetical protein [Thermococcus sp.]
MSTEEYPVHPSIEVLAGETIFKTKKWWMAVLKISAFGRVKYRIYLWLFQDGAWVAKQKLTIVDSATWEKIKAAVDLVMGK